MQSPRINILIIDNDLGSVFWLGQALDAAGYEALPAKNIPDAKVLLAEKQIFVDLLIMRIAIPGIAAFVKELVLLQGSLKAIGLLEDNEDLDLGVPMDAWIRKPLVTDEASKLEYLELIGPFVEDSRSPSTRTKVGERVRYESQ